MKIEIYKSKEGGYTTDKNKASEFLFEVELGQKFYCVILKSKLGGTLLDYTEDPDKWNYSKLLEEACKGIATDKDYGFHFEDEEFEGESVCTMYECWFEEDEAGRYDLEFTPIRKAKVTYNEER